MLHTDARETKEHPGPSFALLSVYVVREMLRSLLQGYHKYSVLLLLCANERTVEYSTVQQWCWRVGFPDSKRGKKWRINTLQAGPSDERYLVTPVLLRRRGEIISHVSPLNHREALPSPSIVCSLEKKLPQTLDNTFLTARGAREGERNPGGRRRRKPKLLLKGGYFALPHLETILHQCESAFNSVLSYQP